MTDGAILEDGADARDPKNEKESHEVHDLAESNLSPNRIGQEMDKEIKTKTKQKIVLEDCLMNSARNG